MRITQPDCTRYVMRWSRGTSSLWFRCTLRDWTWWRPFNNLTNMWVVVWSHCAFSFFNELSSWAAHKNSMQHHPWSPIHEQMTLMGSILINQIHIVCFVLALFLLNEKEYKSLLFTDRNQVRQRYISQYEWWTGTHFILWTSLYKTGAPLFFCILAKIRFDILLRDFTCGYVCAVGI